MIEHLESNLIGLLLKNEKELHKISGLLEAADFTNRKYNLIFDYFNKNNNTTYADLVDKKLITAKDAEGLIDYKNLKENNIVKLAKLIKNNSTVNRFKLLCETAQSQADNQTNIYDYIEKHNKELLQISENKTDKLIKPNEAMKRLATYYENFNINNIYTGYGSLDDIIGGIDLTDFLVIAARPGVGKTAFSLNLIHKFSDLGLTTGLINLEMSIEQIFSRCLTIQTGISLKSIRKNYVQSIEKHKAISNIKSNMDSLKMVVYDGNSVNLTDIKRIARWLKKNGANILMIDYLGLITAPEAPNRNAEISIISRELRLLALELKMPVIVFSQLNRASEIRENKVPILSDLRDSGSLEQDACQVWMLHRNEMYNVKNCVTDKNIGSENKLEVFIKKNRQGGLGSVILNFDKFTQTIDDLDVAVKKVIDNAQLTSFADYEINDANF